MRWRSASRAHLSHPILAMSGIIVIVSERLGCSLVALQRKTALSQFPSSRMVRMCIFTASGSRDRGPSWESPGWSQSRNPRYRLYQSLCPRPAFLSVLAWSCMVLAPAHCAAFQRGAQQASRGFRWVLGATPPVNLLANNLCIFRSFFSLKLLPSPLLVHYARRGFLKNILFFPFLFFFKRSV
jgi:hypothetical protein